ncbi:MAG: acetoacetate decarboxylase family protein [Sphingorhabdus sp.]
MMEVCGTYRRRMPTCFGPAPSPRQDAIGQAWSNPIASITAITASFLTVRQDLEALLPSGATLSGEPVVTVEFMYIRNLQWLAGRGYNTLGVRFPVAVASGEQPVTGPFLTVLWENLADPILTGREELGFAKLFCDLPPPTEMQGIMRCRASWDGHSFCELSLENAAEAEVGTSTDDGLLHYYTMPRIGAVGESVTEGWALTPPSPNVEILSHKRGTAAVRFIKSSWEDLPTLAHVVNRLAALPMLEARGGTVTELRSDTSLHNHRLLLQEGADADR